MKLPAVYCISPAPTSSVLPAASLVRIGLSPAAIMRIEDGNRNHGIKVSLPWRKYKHIIADTDFENYLLHAPDSSAYTNSQNVFMIQLPIKDAAEKALEIIKSNAKKHG